MTREETVVRMVARTRPGEQFRIARELRRRIRERLDALEIASSDPSARTSAPGADASAPRTE
jgi:small conductance mechanosensitive channel